MKNVTADAARDVLARMVEMLDEEMALRSDDASDLWLYDERDRMLDATAAAFGRLREILRGIVRNS